MDKKTEDAIQRIGKLANELRGLIWGALIGILIFYVFIGYNIYQESKDTTQMTALANLPIDVNVVNFNRPLFNDENNHYIEIGSRELSESAFNQISFNCDEYYSLPLTETRLYVNFKVSNNNIGYRLSDLCGIAGREL